MPKPSSVTQEAVNKVALDLFLRGVNPSINVVQAELRRHVGAPGSTTVVTRLLEAWKKSIAETLSAHLESSPPNAVEVLAKELAVAAAERASVEYEAWKAEVQSSAQDAIRQSQERAATLVVDNQRLVMELGSATQEVKQLSEALARTETENAALASSLDQKAIAEAALNQEVSALKQAIDACTEAARAAKHEHEQNLAVLRVGRDSCKKPQKQA